MDAIVSTLRVFTGLAHRCQLIPSNDGIVWLNDSKATNVGATLAALDGLQTHQGNIVLIAGGDAKGGDLSPLTQSFEQQISELIVMGKDAELFSAIRSDAHHVESMQAAVKLANTFVNPGDIVLLSPACASIDMFVNYMERGQQFMDAVGRVNEH